MNTTFIEIIELRRIEYLYIYFLAYLFFGLFSQLQKLEFWFQKVKLHILIRELLYIQIAHIFIL